MSRTVAGVREELLSELNTGKMRARMFNLSGFKKFGIEISRVPYSVRVVIENVLRDPSSSCSEEDVMRIAEWKENIGKEIAFMPYRVLLQDYTGVPLVVDLAAMRDALKERGINPRNVDTRVPVHLVIDHSVQVDSWAVPEALTFNLAMDYKRNSERYSLLKWAQSSFTRMTVFPPGKGICHQVNLEYISKVAVHDEEKGFVFPDTLIGTDSHTPMVNGMGVLGWGVGGIEAEAVMLGEPHYISIPKVVGVRLRGRLTDGATTTDLVLKVTEELRKRDLVDSFVEFFGEGYRRISVPERATIANMAPEYGATTGFFPVDDMVLSYLRLTGRSNEHIELVEKYFKQASLFYMEEDDLDYSYVIDIDLEKVEPSVSGPRNPEERVSLRELRSYLSRFMKPSSNLELSYSSGFQALQQELNDGSVVIAAITSCTNTSNPTLMIGAALVAKNAYELGLKPKAWVKTSFAPGSAAVSDYLEKAGLIKYLNYLGFNVVGYGCTTCIGNSGPLAGWVEEQIRKKDIYTVAVLSGNRNFDGRIHPLVKGSFLMSPMLVVIFSLVGNINFDPSEPIGISSAGRKVYMKDIWPSIEEINEYIEKFVSPEVYVKRYSNITQGDDKWNSLISYSDDVYHWDVNSTYIARPPWFEREMLSTVKSDIVGARALLVLGDKITTDHISPAGIIPYDSPAGKYLSERGVNIADFSTYGSRRGNHEVMVRGGFANIRIRNILAAGREGWWTTHIPSGELMTIYEASLRYKREKTPLIVIAGKQYGTGSSRDWAAKATRLLGIRAVIAESFERIHRSNLVAMGVLPLEFERGENFQSLGLTGMELFDIRGIERMNQPREKLEVIAKNGKSEKRFVVTCRIDNRAEMKYIETGGLLQYVFNRITKKE
jgi:aconitate hydratase